MNDRIIRRAIEKTYFIIITLLLFIFLTFTFVFILLQNGLHIKEVSLSNLHIKQLYIKWDEKIDISVKEINIQTQKESQESAFDYKSLSKYTQALKYTTEWFKSITIESIKFNEFDASFNYSQNSQGFLILKSPTLLLSSRLSYEKNILKMSIGALNEREKKISAKGDIVFDLIKEEAFINLNASINNDANVTFNANLNTTSMDFTLKSHKKILDIKYLIQLASLPSEIKFWTQDAINVKSVEIEALRGTIEFNNMQNAYKNIYAKLKANGLIYTYNTKIDGVHTEYTEVEFKDGVLFIHPQEANSYGNSLGESWLKIDFTSKDEMLTLHLLFDGQLNKKMLQVLNAYKIKLPFLQKSGTVTTDLQLIVNLLTIDIDAQGSFYVKKGNFDYLGLNVDIFDAEIDLDNYLVKIDKMKARYKDVAQADVKVLYDAKLSQGSINFYFNAIAFDKLRLAKDSAKLNATYTISPAQDKISIENSIWNFQEHTLLVDAFEAPVDVKNLNLKIPTTFLKLDGTASAFAEGSVDLKNNTTEFSLDVLNLSYEGVEFSQSNTPFSIKYDEALSINSPDKLYFNIAGTEYMIDKPILIIDKDELVLKNTKLTMGKYASTKIYAKHNIKDAKTHISLSDFVLKNYKQDKVLYEKKKILLSMKKSEDGIEVSSKELEATAKSTKDGWSVHLNSLSQIATNSKLLKSLHLRDGDFTLYKNRDSKYAQFKSQITYPYKILTKDGKPTDLYSIEGEIRDEKVSLSINKNTKVNISDNIEINSSNTGINLQALLKLTQSFQNEQNDTKNVDFKATNSYLYLSDSRKIISDLIKLNYTNDILTAQLKHAKGKASFRLEGDVFHLYGKGFNDTFMQELFYLSKFKGGTFDFSLSGTTSEYDGILYIKDSTIVKYKLLNNILAFINTVPSLVTFSLPGYSKKGLFTKEAYIKFTANKSLLHLSDIYLESKELTISGTGDADPKEDMVDITLNLQTDLGSNASQIPLVGHVIFNGESVATTLEITGKLSDPKVKSLLAQEIMVAPINIIKRTLMLPYDLLKSFEGKN